MANSIAQVDLTLTVIDQLQTAQQNIVRHVVPTAQFPPTMPTPLVLSQAQVVYGGYIQLAGAATYTLVPALSNVPCVYVRNAGSSGVVQLKVTFGFLLDVEQNITLAPGCIFLYFNPIHGPNSNNLITKCTAQSEDTATPIIFEFLTAQ